ncbi:flagellar hook protein FlgE [Paludibacterium paludis]|uniref:Flagellar hook protein FlgE n=1 Tax=Paludibacterium paludis TaxID=1225769 RepID=A0A918NYX7_9NEIS|nr:flagellar hook protein FlgE [Paludibacterium paludis]GGY06669.1 flagellar hook protein FlgE [Paludibacterium paludis]
MGFQQGLSGLSAASKQLDVIGNNVANASTVGFKQSRAEFADMYATSFYGVASTAAGIGVNTAAVTQQHTQGNITPTARSLDMAINNNGFFIVKAGASTANSAGTIYATRNGQFQVDQQGYIVNTSGDRLQGWTASTGGVVTQGPVNDLQLQTALINPKVTSAVGMGVNLDSRMTPTAGTTLDPTKTNTFNWSNATTVYDSLGNPHNLTLYYQKAAPTTTGTDWVVNAYVDGNPATAPNTFTLNFNTNGALTTTAKFPVSFTPAPVNGSATPVSFTVDYTGSTQYGQNAGTTSLTNDGYAPGTLRAINIDKTGIIQATYTNSQTRTIGQVAIGNFTNPQGLQPSGNNHWVETYSSGPMQINAPGSGTAGLLQSAALEDSNVDLTTELVNMITAQRFYQANAQTVKTQDQVLQTLINLR